MHDPDTLNQWSLASAGESTLQSAAAREHALCWQAHVDAGRRFRCNSLEQTPHARNLERILPAIPSP